ncbi:MAG: phospho-N-acetylmuramoyl-pentapeptide-transferase [Lachnospiraceae bacterium]|nr:phospho-N-acetylmuramoyl-pentapeptide-transferase [Lachnospiraceae bacterium]
MLIWKQIALPILTAFAIVAVLGPFVIPYLRKVKFGQTERDDGPSSHLKKNGTPTMGGIMILIAFTATGFIFMKKAPVVLPVILMVLAFGLIGFVDDFLKVVLHRSDGFKAWQKLICQVIVTLIFMWYMTGVSGISLMLRIPFLPDQTVDIGFLAPILMLLAVVGTTNGTNFTDGVDGLLTCVTLPVALFFLVASAHYQEELVPVCAAMIGALLGFLLYNAYPARIFMGDTGSLAIGGFVAALAYMLQMPIFIILVGFIYLLEVVSVMIQVLYFKATHGKRFFRMAPIHHHFELGGWSEVLVVAVFSIVTVMLCLVACIAAGF